MVRPRGVAEPGHRDLADGGPAGSACRPSCALRARPRSGRLRRRHRGGRRVTRLGPDGRDHCCSRARSRSCDEASLSPELRRDARDLVRSIRVRTVARRQQDASPPIVLACRRSRQGPATCAACHGYTRMRRMLLRGLALLVLVLATTAAPARADVVVNMQGTSSGGFTSDSLLITGEDTADDITITEGADGGTGPVGEARDCAQSRLCFLTVQSAVSRIVASGRLRLRRRQPARALCVLRPRRGAREPVHAHCLHLAARRCRPPADHPAHQPRPRPGAAMELERRLRRRHRFDRRRDGAHGARRGPVAGDARAAERARTSSAGSSTRARSGCSATPMAPSTSPTPTASRTSPAATACR